MLDRWQFSFVRYVAVAGFVISAATVFLQLLYFPLIERLDVLEARLDEHLHTVQHVSARPELSTKLASADLKPEESTRMPTRTRERVAPPLDAKIKIPPEQFWLNASLKCGEFVALPDGTVAGCDPNGKYPCCGSGGWCGITPQHCSCQSCIDYRKGHNVEQRLKLKLRQGHVPGSDGTFSQNYQDTWLVRLAQRNGWPLTAQGSHGFFLDLGAFHGIHCSNSALLEKKYGWSGICVEPLPVGFEERTCTVVARALSDRSDEVVRFVGLGQEKKIGNPGEPGVDVMTITIKGLLDCINGTASQELNCSGISGRRHHVPKFIHFVSLDIEGMEPRLLRTFPWADVQVAVWVMEINAPGRSRNDQDDARHILTSHGYIKAPVDNPGVDEYYVLPQFWEDSLKAKPERIHPPGSEGC